jgi:hypothetical protein
MSAIVVVDFAYKGPKRTGYGTGRKGLQSLLKYLQYRDNRNNHLATDRHYERWNDRGLGKHHSEILGHCDDLKSEHVLAWTWVVSPAPDLMQLVPETQQRALVCQLTERVVEDYYAERDFCIPEYAYVLHERQTHDDQLNHLHTHVILPGTAPDIAERLPVYNNKERGHDALFRDVASRHFAELLDETIGLEWREHRPDPEPERSLLEAWFPR